MVDEQELLLQNRQLSGTRLAIEGMIKPLSHEGS